MDGKNFESFMGGDDFDKKVRSQFDDFLSASFGEKLFRGGQMKNDTWRSSR